MVLLTKTEYTVLAQVKLGLTNKEIAYKLSVEDNTVRFHVHNILKKYGTKNRSELIGMVNREHMLECPSCGCKLTFELGLAAKEEIKPKEE